MTEKIKPVIDIDNITKIKAAIGDSIHDFIKERKTTANSEDVDSLGINENTHANTVNELWKLTCPIVESSEICMYPSSANNWGKLLQKITNGFITSTTGTNVGGIKQTYEQRTQSYFELETVYKERLGIINKQKISYQEILYYQEIGRYPDELNNLLLDRNTVNTQRVLEIYEDENYNPPEGSVIPIGFGAQKGYIQNNFNNIANFILNYMFPERNIGGTNTFMTFDASPKYVNKIFRNIEQTYNLLIPQNLSDSATSSTSQLNNRMVSIFPSNIGDGINWEFKSNIFSNETPFMDVDGNLLYNVAVTLGIQNNGFDNNNTLGFSLVFIVRFVLPDSTVGDEQIFIKSFNANQKSGPSVNYLSHLIELATENKLPNGTSNYKTYTNAIPSFATIINIGEQLDNISDFLFSVFQKNYIDEATIRANTSDIIIKILFDLKRSGDWEQALGALEMRKTEGQTKNSVIYVSLDRLSALYSRLLENPTIWHNNQNLFLYRFPTELPSEQLIKLLKMKELITQAKKNLEVVNLADEIRSNLLVIYNLIGTNTRTSFTNISKLSKSNFNKYSIFIGMISTILLRFKLLYTQNKISNIIELLNSIESVANPEFLDLKMLTEIEEKINTALPLSNDAKEVIIQQLNELPGFQEYFEQPLSEDQQLTLDNAISLLNIPNKSWKGENLRVTLIPELEKVANSLFVKYPDGEIVGRIRDIKIPLLELDTSLFNANGMFQETLNFAAQQLETNLRLINRGKELKERNNVYKIMLEKKEYGKTVEDLFPLFDDEGLTERLKTILLLSQSFNTDLNSELDTGRLVELIGSSVLPSGVQVVTFHKLFEYFRSSYNENAMDIFLSRPFLETLPEFYIEKLKKMEGITLLSEPIPERFMVGGNKTNHYFINKQLQVGGAFPKIDILQYQELDILLNNICGIANTYITNDLDDINRTFGSTWNNSINFRLQQLFLPCGSRNSDYYCNNNNPNRIERINNPEDPYLLKGFNENYNSILATADNIRIIYLSELNKLTMLNNIREETIDNSLFYDDNIVTNDSGELENISNNPYTFIPTNGSLFISLLLSTYYDVDVSEYIIDYSYITDIYKNYFLQHYPESSEILQNGINEENIIDLFSEFKINGIFKIIGQILRQLNLIIKKLIIETELQPEKKLIHINIFLNYYILLIFSLMFNDKVNIGYQDSLIRMDISKKYRNFYNPNDWNQLIAFGSVIHWITIFNSAIFNSIFKSKPFVIDSTAFGLMIGRGKKKKTRRNNPNKNNSKKNKKTKKHK